MLRAAARRALCSVPAAPLRTSAPLGACELAFETGRIAFNAGGAVMASCGGSSVLATAVTDFKEPEETFLPLQVDYREKAYALQQFPGTRDRQERSNDPDAILTARVIDRVLRPLFVKGFALETQIVATLHAYGAEAGGDPVSLAVNAASAALVAQGAPWRGPVGCVRVALVDGELKAHPSAAELAASPLDLLYAANQHRTLMIEAEGAQVPEADMVAALRFAHAAVAPIVEAQRSLVTGGDGGDWDRWLIRPSPAAWAAARGLRDECTQMWRDGGDDKKQLATAQGRMEARMAAAVRAADPEASAAAVEMAVHDVMEETLRGALLASGGARRLDGRGAEQVRALGAEAGVLGAGVHGSALFTRGETQTLCTATVGTLEQAVDRAGEAKPEHEPDLRSFFLHYEFPPYAVNEVGKVGGVNRRMVGHGALAEKALRPVVPPVEEFPFAVRVTSEVTASNGSSSMASVCGGSMALQHAGVPIASPVAGISVGLVAADADPAADSTDDAEAGHLLLTDILGSEDHYGDMDFKVAGTRGGVTAIQLDVKLPGVPPAVLERAVERARVARMGILDTMAAGVSAAGPSAAAIPLVRRVEVDPLRAFMVWGPGGSTRQELQLEHGVDIVADRDTGVVHVYGVEEEAVDKVATLVEQICADPQIGEQYEGVVTEVLEFGARVQLWPQCEGYLHVSEMSHNRVVPDEVVALGDVVQVWCVARDKVSKKTLLSMKRPLVRETYASPTSGSGDGSEGSEGSGSE